MLYLKIFVEAILVLVLVSFVFLPYQYAEDKANDNQALIDALENLKDATLKKIDYDIDRTATAFTNAKNIWRSKRWADIFNVPLAIIKGTINIIGSILAWEDIAKNAQNVLDSSEANLEIASLMMTLEEMQQVGEDLQLAIDGPTYTSSVEGMLEAADVHSSITSFDYEGYKGTIRSHLYMDYGPIVIPHKSSDISRGNSGFAKGVLEIRRDIANSFRDLINEFSSKTLPETFPKEETIKQINELAIKIKQSLIQDSVDIQYEAYLKDGDSYVLRTIDTSLGSIACLEKIRILALNNFAKKMKMEQESTIRSAVNYAMGVTTLYVGTKYKSAETGEVLGVVKKVGIVSSAIDLASSKLFYTDAEEQVYMIPQEMTLSLPGEFSNLWMVTDDTIKYIRHLMNSFPSPTQDTADIILTIDRSGSMENPISATDKTQRIVVARKAAEEFTHFVIPGDYVGIVDYAGDVKVTQPLSSGTVEVLRNKISQIQVGGSGTNIGAPLGTAYQELEKSTSGNTSTVVILLTDGAHNTGTEPLTVVKNSPNFVNQTWPIYTIGLGSGDEFNEPLLQEIAKETGGQYKHASSAQELGDFYATLAARIRGGTTLVRLRDFINHGQTITHAVEFDPLIETSHLILNWGGSQLELNLTTPQGESITPTSDGIEYSSGENYLIYKINQPESGKWFAKIHGSDVTAGGEQYILSVTGTSDVISSLLPFKPRYNPGDKISIGVELLARGTQGKPANITDITAEAHILRPDGLTETASLSDIGEGVYAGDYTNTALLGSYLITVQLHGTTSSGAPFSRNITEAVIVGDIYQIVISQTSLRPEPESVVTDATPTIQARISGPSRNIDVDSINLTLDNAAVPHTYDPVNQLISYNPQTELASEKHLVTLDLKDAQGSAIPKAHWQFIVDTEADYWFLHGETQRLMRLSVKDDEVRVVESIKGVDPQGVYVIDRRDGTCWFESPHLRKVNCYGGESIFSFGELGAPMALAIDDANRTLWVADGGLNQVVKIDREGNIQEKVQLSSPPKAIASRADGGLWVATSREIQIITADGKLTEPIKQRVKYLHAVAKTDEIWAGDAITGHVFHISGSGSTIAEGGIKSLLGIVATNDGGCWLLGRKTAFALNPDGSLRGTVQGLSNPRTVIFQPSDGSVWVQEGSNQLLRLYRPFSGDASFLRITGLTFGNLAIKPATDLKWTPAQPSTPPRPTQPPKTTQKNIRARTAPDPPEQTPKKIQTAPKPKPEREQQPEKQIFTTPEEQSENSERREENEQHYQGHWNLIPRDTTILMTADMTVVRDDNELIQATPIKDIIPLLNQINISTADVTKLTLWGTSAQESSNIDGAVLVTGQYQVKRVLEHLHQAGWKQELYGQDELYLNPQEEAESVAGISNDTIALGSINALKTVLDVKYQKQATIWQRRDIVTLLRNSASSDAPVTVALLIPQDVFDMANAALTISRSILSLCRVPVIGILMEKIGVAQALGVHISHQGDSFPVEFLCLMADEDAASFLSGTLNLLKASTSALPQDKMDAQSQEAMEIFRQMKVSREERLFYIQIVIPRKEFMNIQK